MTTDDQPFEAAEPNPTGARAGPPRPLRRRADNRVIGGVAAGLADYLRVDPLLIRAGFAGLMIFGGAGLVLYVAGWLLIPSEDRPESVLEAFLGRAGLSLDRLVVGAVVLGFVAVATAWLLRGSSGRELVAPLHLDPGALWAIAVIVTGFVLLRGGGRLAPVATRVTKAPASDGPPPPIDAVAPASMSGVRHRPARERAPRERSPLAGATVAAVLAAIGLLAVVGLGGAVVTPGQYAATAVAVVGLGLVVGAWWGRGRLLVLLGLVLLPVALLGALVTVPLAGGVADQAFRPRSVAELRPEYRLVGGSLELDLSQLRAGPEPVRLVASVGVGELVVLVPEGAAIEIDARVGGGRLLVLGGRQTGTGLVDRIVNGGRGPGLVLDLEAGVGQVRVERRTADGS